MKSAPTTQRRALSSWRLRPPANAERDGGAGGEAEVERGERRERPAARHAALTEVDHERGDVHQRADGDGDGERHGERAPRHRA